MNRRPHHSGRDAGRDCQQPLSGSIEATGWGFLCCRLQVPFLWNEDKVVEPNFLRSRSHPRPGACTRTFGDEAPGDVGRSYASFLRSDDVVNKMSSNSQSNTWIRTNVNSNIYICNKLIGLGHVDSRTESPDMVDLRWIFVSVAQYSRLTQLSFTTLSYYTPLIYPLASSIAHESEKCSMLGP